MWIGLPLSLMMLGLFAAGAFTYPRLLAPLLIDRHRQLAAVSAASVSEVIYSYAHLLETLAGNPGVHSASPEERTATLEAASGAQAVFNAGLLVLDREGDLISSTPLDSSLATAHLDQQEIHEAVTESMAPVLRNIITAANNAESMLVVAVPVYDERDAFDGTLVGAVFLRTTLLGNLVENLTIGLDGFAYLVDPQGRVILHADPAEIGADYSNRPFIDTVLAGETTGVLWESPTGRLLIEASAPVGASGWGLIVQESWESMVAPTQGYLAIIGVIGIAAVLLVVFVTWQVMRRVVTPVQLLAAQTTRLAQGEILEPFEKTGIYEIDVLERSFAEMAAQIATYRAGLRRYVGAITQSQEDERRRIARELHDETVQNLLTIARRLEFSQASEVDPARQQRLAELQSVVTDTLNGVRQISRDLRPLMLEDLGLVPALQALVRAAHHGEGALPHAKFEVQNRPVSLHPDQELALYRITQEALTNVRKHAQAIGARVELIFEPGRVRLEVSDDGTGFEVPANLAELTQRGSFGLMGIQERVWAMDGALTIQSTPGQGTHLSVSMPVHERASLAGMNK